MSVKIGINGFGRIGRVLRIALSSRVVDLIRHIHAQSRKV